MADQEYLTVGHLGRKEIARLFSKITVDPATSCWNWQAARIYGYGIVWLNGRNESTHRVMFAWLVQPLPRGLRKGIPVLDHIVCENPQCCNPAHVRLVPNVENLRRTGAVSAVNARKTHCINGHQLPDRPNRSNGYGRVCVTCANKRQREAKRAEAAALRALRPTKPVITPEERAQRKRDYFRQWYAKNREVQRAYQRERQRKHRAKLQQHTDS